MFDFKFDWKDSLCTGIEVIDNQNKELFRIGRNIEQLLLRKCIGATTQELLNIVCELREYVSYHFYEEERLMMQAGCSDFEEHKKAHEQLKKMVKEIDCVELGKNPYKEMKRIKEFLTDWIFEHLMIEDLQEAKCIMKTDGQE
ncbi:bacteriohemerythrin [Anaeromicropila populeti]|uniref:Hemerythrin n=1 Tax=Anaeromicropila populeti TaxID=37658 RepID=A0A1I6JS75_9FIRM|nr:hemerythrin family protein [Anaeromicropila populeti]SFR81827.1 hemerythrin [Anaeromicropila populeti]